MHSSKRASSGRPIDRNKDIAIIDATRAILMESGVMGVTMEAVAQRACISKATLYSRYQNRHALIDAVLQSQTDEFAQSLQSKINHEHDFLQALTQFCWQLLQFLQSESHICLVKILQSHQQLPPELAKRMFELGPDATCQHLCHWLEQYQCYWYLGQSEPLDAKFSTDHLLGMLVGIDMIHQMFLQDVARSIPEQLQHIRRVLRVFFSAYGATYLHAPLDVVLADIKLKSQTASDPNMGLLHN